MSERKDERTQKLLDAFNQIDDKLIADAQTPSRVLAFKKAKQRFMQSAVAVACVFAVVISGAIHNAVSNDVKTQDSTQDTYQNVQKPSADNPTTLESALTSPHSSKKVKKVSKEQIDLFESPSVIWRVNGEQEYNVVKVSSGSSKALRGSMTLTSTALTPEEADAISVQVWVALGDGRVVSPYLKASAGNVGFAELFEYTPEIEPNEEFTSLINDLIS